MNQKHTVSDFNSCPVCSGNIGRENRDISLSYKDKKITINQPGQYCSDCGESFFSASDLAETGKKRIDFQKDVDHLLKSDEIREIRKKLNLSQKKAGNIFGGGPMAFSKYERGIIKQTRSLDVLFRLIRRKKVCLEDIMEVGEEAVL